MTGTVVSGRAMERVELSVHFQCKEDDGSHLFLFPRGGRIQVPENVVERSLLLRDMLESAANCGDTTIPFPASVELSHFHIWAAAVQPDSPVLQADAERMKRALEVRCCTYMHKWYCSILAHPSLAGVTPAPVTGIRDGCQCRRRTFSQMEV